jgi:UTP--glucose-1-phosphate uridylyltransferase
MLAKEDEVYAHIFEGDRFDTGNVESYLNATVEFALRTPNVRPIMEKIIREKMSKYKL